jgi:hypothetical protein
MEKWVDFLPYIIKTINDGFLFSIDNQVNHNQVEVETVSFVFYLYCHQRFSRRLINIHSLEKEGLNRSQRKKSFITREEYSKEVEGQGFSINYEFQSKVRW